MKKVTDYHICENELCENPYCTCNPCLCAPDDECPCCVGTPDKMWFWAVQAIAGAILGQATNSLLADTNL